MNRTRLIFLFGLGIALVSSRSAAVLPPDAVARAPQLRAEYTRNELMYQERMKQRQAAAVQAYEKTRADIFTPPWARGENPGAIATGSGSASAGKMKQAPKRNHRLLISIVLLILISSGAGWTRYATRKRDE